MLFSHQHLFGVAILYIEFRGMLLCLRQSIYHVGVKLRAISCRFCHVGPCQHILIISFSYKPIVLKFVILEKDVCFVKLSLSKYHFKATGIIVNILNLNRIIAQRRRNINNVRLRRQRRNNCKVLSMAKVMSRIYNFSLIATLWLLDIKADHHGLGGFKSGFS